MQKQKPEIRAPKLTELWQVPTEPGHARKFFGVRFHHFFGRRFGHLVGTIVTIPDPDRSKGLLVAGTVSHSDDIATRTGGRREAWASLLLRGRYVRMSLADVQDAIRDRSVFEVLFEADNETCPTVVRRKNLRLPKPPTPEMIAKSKARAEAEAAIEAIRADEAADHVAQPITLVVDGGASHESSLAALAPYVGADVVKALADEPRPLEPREWTV